MGKEKAHLKVCDGKGTTTLCQHPSAVNGWCRTWRVLVPFKHTCVYECKTCKALSRSEVDVYGNLFAGAIKAVVQDPDAETYYRHLDANEESRWQRRQKPYMSQTKRRKLMREKLHKTTKPPLLLLK